MLFGALHTILFVVGTKQFVNQPSAVVSSSRYLPTRVGMALNASQTTLLEVCLSPGCVADGGDGVLLKMQALASPDYQVKPGVCCSLCGNGPVVMNSETNKKYRKVSESKILEILIGEAGLSEEQQAVLEGFNLIEKADEAVKRNDYTEAIELYEKGISTGIEAALVMDKAQKDDGDRGDDDDDDDRNSSTLRWLVQARQKETSARLTTGGADGAVSSAQSACELSGNTCADSLELLHEAYQAKGNEQGEYTALTALFDLPEPSKMTMMQANKRRELGFRLAKLQKEFS